MSQRWSKYERKERDLYETPEWVTQALLPHLPKGGVFWEPACASGKMVRVLRTHTLRVLASDVEPLCERSTKEDFLKTQRDVDCIVTNPPFDQSSEFIIHAMTCTKKNKGCFAMLLRTDFDHAKTRRWLFGDNPIFSKKLVLLRRITWFEPEPGAKGKSPSFNHAWFMWDWKHDGPPTIVYGG